MQKRLQLLVLAFMFLAVLTVMPSEVQASEYYDADECLQVEIEFADYLDYDADDFADDIVTIFSIELPKNPYDDWGGKTEITCWLTYPSGTSLGISFVVKIGEGIKVTILWLNCAIEKGWYTFHVYAYPLGKNAPGAGWDDCSFDPPKGSPAPPVIEIAWIEELGTS